MKMTQTATEEVKAVLALVTLTDTIADLIEEVLFTHESVEDWAEDVYMNQRNFADDPTVKAVLAIVTKTMKEMAQDAVGCEWDDHRTF